MGIKLFVRILKKIETGCEDIKSSYRDGIWHRKIRHANND